MEDKRSIFSDTGKKMICDSCGGRCKFIAQGIYKCTLCGETVLDEYGRVRTYLEENGMTPAAIIADDTGVPIQTIQNYLRNGKLEIPEGSDFYIQCEKCGMDIRYGRYCPSCAAQLSKDLQGTIHIGNIGEVPKDKKKGRMRFLGNTNKSEKK